MTLLTSSVNEGLVDERAIAEIERCSTFALRSQVVVAFMSVIHGVVQEMQTRIRPLALEEENQ